MNGARLLRELREAGVRFTAAGDRLRWRGPRAVLTEDVKAKLREHKGEILEALEREELAVYGLMRCERCRRILLKQHVAVTPGGPTCTDYKDCTEAKARADACAEHIRRE